MKSDSSRRRGWKSRHAFAWSRVTCSSTPNPVIPIRTGGRSYGALSERVVAEGVLLPDLNMTDRQAEFVPPYLFMAILDDGDELWDLSVSCAALACMHTALRAGIKQIAMPVLECKGELTFIAAAERGILFALIAESDEWQFPGHTFVTGGARSWNCAEMSAPSVISTHRQW